MTVMKGGLLKRRVSGKEAVRGVLIQSDWYPPKKRKLGHTRKHQERVCPKGKPCEDTGRR